MTCKQRLLLLNHNMHFLTSFMLGFAKFALTALLTWKRSWRLIRLNGLVLGFTPFLFRMLVLLCLFWSIVQLYGSALVMKFWAPLVVVAFTLQAILTHLAFTNYRVLARFVSFLVTMLFGIAFILWVNRQAFLCKENLSICFKMVRGIYQLIFIWFAPPWSWFVCWCDDKVKLNLAIIFLLNLVS